MDLMNIIYPYRKYYRKDLQIPHSTQGLTCGRLRVGRNGRVWFDQGTAQTLKARFSDSETYLTTLSQLKYDDLSDEDDWEPILDLSIETVNPNLERKRSRIWRQMLTLRCKLLGNELGRANDSENTMRLTPNSAAVGPNSATINESTIPNGASATWASST